MEITGILAKPDIASPYFYQRLLSSFILASLGQLSFPSDSNAIRFSILRNLLFDSSDLQEFLKIMLTMNPTKPTSIKVMVQEKKTLLPVRSDSEQPCSTPPSCKSVTARRLLHRRQKQGRYF